MSCNQNKTTVLAVEPVKQSRRAAGHGIVIGGRMVEVSQDHLLEPLVHLLTSVEQMATVASLGKDGPNEEACVRTAYRSLYLFFHTLLPSASHQVIDGLTYSVSLLLVGEAIEVGRHVVGPPTHAQKPAIARSPTNEAPGRSKQ